MPDFLTRFKELTADLESLSSGTALRDCRVCVQTEYDMEQFEDGEHWRAVEPYFSWSQCETCGSELGGTREDAHAYYDGGLIHLSICTDCVVYLANGELPSDE